METTRNMTLKIDPYSMDLVMDDGGDFALIYEDETTAQAVRLTLQAWEGDFPLDESHGTEWGQILGASPLTWATMRRRRLSEKRYSRKTMCSRLIRCPLSNLAPGALTSPFPVRSSAAAPSVRR